MLMVFCNPCYRYNGLIFCFQHSQDDRASLTEDDIKRGTKTKEKDELQKAYMIEKKIPLKQCGSVVVGIDIKTT